MVDPFKPEDDDRQTERHRDDALERALATSPQKRAGRVPAVRSRLGEVRRIFRNARTRAAALGRELSVAGD